VGPWRGVVNGNESGNIWEGGGGGHTYERVVSRVLMSHVEPLEHQGSFVKEPCDMTDHGCVT